MARKPWMLRFARWHIWLGWLAGAAILMWTFTGLYMVARPIEEVRGEHLRIEQKPQALVIEGSGFATRDKKIKEMRAVMQNGKAVAILTSMDGAITRVDMTSGKRLAPLDAAGAAALVARRIRGGTKLQSVRFYPAAKVPFDFRRPLAVWQVALRDGTHVYVGRDTGEIEAVRTRWWRGFDFMWGLHIMDPRAREDTSHPILIFFAIISVAMSILGMILLFRRRKARV